MNWARRLSMLLVAALLFACGAKVKFEPYVSTAGRFQVMVPERLNYSVGEQIYLDEKVQVHVHTVTKNGIVYTVNYFDLPAAVSEKWRRKGGSFSFIPGEEEMIITKGWVPDESAGTSLWTASNRDVRGHRFVVTEGDKVIQFKHFWHEHRIYQVMLTRPRAPTYSQNFEANKFFDSFNLH